MGRAGGEFGQVFFAELAPLRRMRVKPHGVRGRRDVLHPRVERGGFFRQTARPQPVYEARAPSSGAGGSYTRLMRIVMQVYSNSVTVTISALGGESGRFYGEAGLISKRAGRSILIVFMFVALTALAGCDSGARESDAELGLNGNRHEGRRVYEARC